MRRNSERDQNKRDYHTYHHLVMIVFKQEKNSLDGCNEWYVRRGERIRVRGREKTESGEKNGDNRGRKN